MHSTVPTLKLDTSVPHIMSAEALVVSPTGMTPAPVSPRPDETSSEPFPDMPITDEAEHSTGKPDLEESFELVEDPKDDADGYEDKNR